MKTYSPEDVAQTLKRNRYRSFPSLNQGHERLFPFARPKMTISRPFPKDAKFFVAGNCFARGLEKALSGGGFTVLSSAYSDKLPGGVTDQFQNFNKFNLDVAINEIAWATGLAGGMNESLIRVGDEFVDMQLHFSVAYPEAKMKEYRRLFNQAYESAAKADVVILIVGGQRQWFDRQTGLYLNGMPTRKMTSLYPERFELHSLDLADAEQRIEHGITTVRMANPDAHVILVNSPVYQPTSFGADDALLEQTLGKSLQRVAISNVVSRNDGVDYLPAYEIVTLSDFSHSFMPGSPNHTLPDVATRVAADMLAAGGLIDDRQKAIEAGGFGLALIRAKESQAAAQLLKSVVLSEDGTLSEIGRKFLGLSRLYLWALQLQGLKKDMLNFGLQVIEGYKKLDDNSAGISAVETLEVLKGKRHLIFERIFHQVAQLSRAVGTPTDRERVAFHADRWGISLATSLEPSEAESLVNTAFTELKQAIESKDQEKAEERLAFLDEHRSSLSPKQRISLDVSAMGHGVKAGHGSKAIERQIGIFMSEGINARTLGTLCNIANAHGSSDQLARIIDLAAGSGIDVLVIDRLRARKERLAKRSR